VVEVTVELGDAGDLWARASGAWHADVDGLPSTELLTIDALLSKRNVSTAEAVVENSAARGYGANWFVYRFEAPSPYAFAEGPTDERFSAMELEDAVQKARQEFHSYFANVSAAATSSAALDTALFQSERFLTKSVDSHRASLIEDGECCSCNVSASCEQPVAFNFSTSADGKTVKSLLRIKLQGLAKAYVAASSGRATDLNVAELGRFIVSAFANLGARGINGTHFDPRFQDEWRKWGDWSFITSSKFKGRTAFNREEGGLAISTLLMRDVLADAGVLHLPQGALRMFTKQWDVSNRQLLTFYGRRSGMNSDAGRILLHSRLWYLLGLEAAGLSPTSSTRAAEMDAWWAYVRRSVYLLST